ncbi:DNA polymerase III subunit gamma and tau [Agromyces sp. G08B096]|uniref:DNA-directed DNA polymerase n=1 Tax=Agromyces sp. G08B096 TaxID=3156399 RepID=A0AAU7W4R5_9MICO
MVTALYRRYRPETFAEMIGQSQVTEPLMTALRTDRVNHAYLFSGPRGCGKTTSARILARCLNCAEGPTDTPCGTCPSCVELSRGGGGSLDVVEIDAASHNGVDDARDLRERAVFAPARDRYKIFILDEAHMVTPQGFNALLKLVEEPPEHVKFIFATTEPDKVLGTIRSRTHHYPFRLVPPAPMLDYVQQLCEEEGITVEPGVLALVVRAGGGSPRDTLSLLDQLIAGSEGSTIDYERAVALLGYTHGALLDEVVDAIGANDAAGAFAAADRVVQTGQDPRRFVEDLLERLRDLIVVAASSPEAAAAVLRGVPEDELARMAAQAKAFGRAELSRVADLVNQTLTEMTGATSPRLHLELMLARVLVPSADDTERGALARVERLERRVGVEGAVPVEPAASADRAAASAPASAPARRPAPATEVGAVTPAPVAESAPARASTARAESPSGAGGAPDPVAAASAAGGAADAGAATAPATTTPAPAVPVGPVTLQQVKDAWPEVLASLQRTKRSAWMVAFTAQVRDYRDDDVLVLGFPSEQDVAGFRGGAPGQSVSELLRNAIAEVLGVRVKFIARAEGAAARDGGSGGGAGADPAAGRPGTGPTAGGAPTGASPTGAGTAARPASAAPAEPPRTAAGGGPNNDAATSAAPSASTRGPAPTGPVDSWATVAIPTDPGPEPADGSVGGSGTGIGGAARDAQPAASASYAVTATALAEPPVRPVDDLPSDDDAPPLDEEPPFDPGPPPEFDATPVGGAADAPVPGSADDAAAASRAERAERGPAAGRGAPVRRPAAAPDGIQRYGEAVVREVLGATFLEEVEAPARGFGERG